MDFWRLERWVRSHQNRNLEDGDLVYVEDGALRVLALGTAGQVLTAQPAATHKLAWMASSGGTGGGGSSDHSALTNLDILASGHTSTPSRVWGSGAAGGASLYQVGLNLQGWSTELDAVAGLTLNGIPSRTGSGAYAIRSLQGPAAGLTVTNPGGVGGNPTFALANDLAALEALGGAGFAVRTTADGWTIRTLVGPAAGITITNPAGVGGDPTWALADDLNALENLTGTGFGSRTGTSTWAVRSFVGGTGIGVQNGDGVSGNPVIYLTGRSVVAVTALGLSTIVLSTLASFVSISVLGSGGGGGGGTSASDASNRAGGGGGAAGGGCHGIWRRDRLPDTLYAWVAAGGTFGTPGFGAGSGEISAVGTTTLNLNGTTAPDFSSTLLYSGGRSTGGAQGVLGGNGGGGGTAPSTSGALWSHAADSWIGFGGANGGATSASGTPTAIAPFSATGSIAGGGAAGAGKSTTVGATGGAFSVLGIFPAVAGGTVGTNPGNPGSAGPGAFPTGVSWATGGTGGGSSFGGGTGGAGGAASYGAGGGGGGAGTTGGNGGRGGDGFIVIETW